MRGALSTGLLGAALILTGALFDAEPLYVPGIAFVVLAAVSSAWVVSGARGVSVLRTVGARRALEDDKRSTAFRELVRRRQPRDPRADDGDVDHP